MTRSPEQTVYRKLSLSASTIALVEEVFFDPARGKPRYGAVSRLVSEKLREWLEENGIHTLTDAARVRDLRAAKPAQSQQESPNVS